MSRPIAPSATVLPPQIQKIDANSLANVDPAILKSAQGMEAMFLNHLFQVMRKNVPQSDMSLESSATKVYRSMMDIEVAQSAARTGGVGLAEQIIAYLESNGYNVRRKSVPPPNGEPSPDGANKYRRYK